MSKYITKEGHAFAKQKLNKQRIKVFNKGKRILKYEGKPNYKITPLDTKIIVGEQLKEALTEGKEENYKKIGLPALERLGLTIVFVDDDIVWAYRQRGYYKIVNKTKRTDGIRWDNQRKHVKIQQDPINKRVRILGKHVWGAGRIDSGCSEWHYYGQDRKQKTSAKTRDLTPDEIRKMAYSEGHVSNTQLKTVNIPEIAFMITEENYILCIPETYPLQRMLVVGKSGKGKSFAVNSFASRLMWKKNFQHKVAWLMDPLDQFFNMSLPQLDNKFIRKLKLFGEEPKPLPVIIFYLSCEDNLNMKHTEEGVSFRLTQNFPEVLTSKYKFYFHGIKEMELSSIRYIEEFRKDFKHAKTKSDIKKIMYANIEDADKNKGIQQMIYKYTNTFGTMFEYNFTSNLFEDDPFECHEWELEFFDDKGNIESRAKGHPFIMAYEAGLIPVLNTAMARRKPWYRNFLADLIQKIIKYQISKGKDNQEPLWLIADEMREVYKDKKRDNLASSFKELITQCRVQTMGYFGNTQSYAELEHEWKENITHLICVNIQNSKERKEIKTQFELTDEEANELGELDTFEMMAISKESDRWVLYDLDGRKVTDPTVLERNAFRGTVLPPVAYHFSPKKK